MVDFKRSAPLRYIAIVVEPLYLYILYFIFILIFSISKSEKHVMLLKPMITACG